MRVGVQNDDETTKLKNYYSYRSIFVFFCYLSGASQFFSFCCALVCLFRAILFGRSGSFSPFRRRCRGQLFAMYRLILCTTLVDANFSLRSFEVLLNIFRQSCTVFGVSETPSDNHTFYRMSSACLCKSVSQRAPPCYPNRDFPQRYSCVHLQLKYIPILQFGFQ